MASKHCTTALSQCNQRHCQGNALPIGGTGGGSASRHPRFVPPEVGVVPVASGGVPPPRRSKAKVFPPPPQPRRSKAKVVPPPPPRGTTAAVSRRKRRSERTQEQLLERPFAGSPPSRSVTWMVYNPYYSRDDVDPTLILYPPAFSPFSSASFITTRPSPTFVLHHHHQRPCLPGARVLLLIAASQQQRQLSGRRASQQQQQLS